ncbi:HAD-IA family hydrolase [Enterococcus sp. LJL98]
MFKNYIWDFDGTLFDTYPVLLDSILQSLLQDFGIQAEPASIYHLLKSESSAAVAQTYGLNFVDFTEKFKEIERRDKRSVHPFDGTFEVLNKITEKQGKNFIFTHRTASSTQALLKEERMETLVVEIIGSESGFPRKPDPTAITYLLKKYQLNPKETLMIGDRRLDIEAGRRAGVATLFFDVENLVYDIQADLRASCMADILKIE